MDVPPITATATMPDKTYKHLAVTALIVAISALGVTMVQRIEIQGLKRKVDAQNQLEQLVKEVRAKMQGDLRRIKSGSQEGVE